MTDADENPKAPRRLPVARCLDDPALRWLAAAVQPASFARLERILADGRRARIAKGAGEADLRSLFATVASDTGVRFELVFEGAIASRSARHKRLAATIDQETANGDRI